MLSACSDRDFSLPEGNVESGKVVFSNLQCIACHTLEGFEDTGIKRTLSVELGGEKTRPYTYAELVTSIINPSHKLASGYAKESVSIEGVSKMRNYNDVMTVSELIDLVTFLESKYSLKPITRTEYAAYH
ncbi:MAG: sulfur-oxidizing protein SoxX [Cryomorphaceae bacterium]|jgi:sulfur-oxidizing protein SoxX